MWGDEGVCIVCVYGCVRMGVCVCMCVSVGVVCECERVCSVFNVKITQMTAADNIV